MTRMKLVLPAALFLAASLPWPSQASTFDFTFTGPGVSGSIDLTYGTATDAKYPDAFEVTGVSGSFTDTNNGLNIVNAPIGALVTVRHHKPEATNLLAPHDFSRFSVGTGLPPVNNGVLTYDNLFWPGGSPPTASDYPLHGGYLDIYGLMFNIGGGRVVDLWSNGDATMTGDGPIDYGVAVATRSSALDYVSGDVSASPEPEAYGLFGTGLFGAFLWRRRRLIH
jgi:hypothetical protein